MGKKTRKTRWRTLSISGQRSDSEESNSNHGPEITKSYNHNHHHTHSNNHIHPGNKFYNKFPYSSQSTPTRRYQHESTKSTRSSSTASEHKITFNEDEYTKITTPRQDVLFKKGYLSKPKTYLPSQNGGTSTGNSTGNGTPDHQSADGTEGTDLEYEQTQFVFPNGFVDQNGIYYVQNFDPFPMVIYNPTPMCYPEYPNTKYNKRYSTDSLTESTSPNNEENGQELSQSGSGGETSANGAPEFGTVFNVVYPGFVYNNGVYPVNDLQNGGQFPSEVRRVKKRRRRKLSARSHTDATTSHEGTTDDCTEDEHDDDDDDEYFSESEESCEHRKEEQQSAQLSANLSSCDTTENIDVPTTNASHKMASHQRKPELQCDANGFNNSMGLPVADSPERDTKQANDVEFVANGDHTSIHEAATEKQVNGETQQQRFVAKEEEESISATKKEESSETTPHVLLENLEQNVVVVKEAQNILLNGLSEEQKQITLDETVSCSSVAINANLTQNVEGVEEEVNVVAGKEEISCSIISRSGSVDETEETKVVGEEEIGAPDAAETTTTTEQNGEQEKPKKTVYRVDAEEFVPRAFRTQELPLPMLNVPGFVPLPVLSDGSAAFGAQFLPPGIPINFIPTADHKMLPNFVNFMPPPFMAQARHEMAARQQPPLQAQQQQHSADCHLHNSGRAAKQQEAIDIAKIVSKLEEAALEQQNGVVGGARVPQEAAERTQRPVDNAAPVDVKQGATPFRSQQKFVNGAAYKNRRPDDNNKFKSRSFDRGGYRKYNGERQSPEQQTYANRYASPVKKHNFVANVESQKVQIICSNGDASNAQPVTLSRSVSQDYSESLKRTNQAKPNFASKVSGNGRKHSEMSSPKIEASSLLLAAEAANRAKPTTNGDAAKPFDNKWISVQSRKKRKNGGTAAKAENDDWPATDDEAATGVKEVDKEFEEYDVNQLVDVVPSITTEKAARTEPKTPTNGEAPQCVPTLATVQAVAQSEPPLEKPKAPEPEQTPTTKQDSDSSKSAKSLAAAMSTPPKNNAAAANRTKAGKSNGKKSGTAKPLQKRVIITDIDLSSQCSTKTSSACNETTSTKTVAQPQPKQATKKQSAAPEHHKTKQTNAVTPKETSAASEKAVKETTAVETKADKKTTAEPVKKEIVEQLTVDETTSVLRTAATSILTAEASVLTVEALVLTAEAPVLTAEVPVLTVEVPVVTVEAPVMIVEAPVMAAAAPALTPEVLDVSLESGALESSVKTVESKVSSESKSPERKSQSKKKKKSKANKQSAKDQKPLDSKSTLLSSSLLNGLNDSEVGCDFLDKSCVEIDSKTNVEISQEIDRMIQRGLYANLEEKMRSLNLAHSTDSFFKTVTSAAAAMPMDALLKAASQENGAAAPTTSTSILLPSTPTLNVAALKVCNGHVDSKRIELDLRKIVDENNAAAAAAHLEQQQTAASKNGIAPAASEAAAVAARAAAPEAAANKAATKESLIVAPITQAVKDWMNKTRENTPELEILKSPSEIKQQYFMQQDEQQLDEDEGDLLSAQEAAQPSVKPQELLLTSSDDDVVVFNAEVDLLECWDDEMAAKATPAGEVGVPEASTALAADVKNGIEQAEDVLEVYESVYGQNSDYLKLKAEVEQEAVQKQQQHQRFAKHGDLPYRAICCSVM